jgi:acetyltransferase
LGIENLDRVFNPKRIVVIGASEREGSLGGEIFRNLSMSFRGEVFPVNPFRKTIQGKVAYPNICRVPRQVDLAVIATPAQTIPQLVEECGQAGVLGLIIISASIDMNSKANQAFERRILEIGKTYGMRIVGPSSFGVIKPRINLHAVLGEKQLCPGKIAFISQSVSACILALDWANSAQIGLSALVSTGSMIDVNLADLMDYFSRDPQTKSMMIYVEFIGNIRSFMSAARDFARNKPIVLVKADRSVIASSLKFMNGRSSISEDDIYRAAFKRAGIVQVEGLGDLFNCAEGLAMQPNPTGPNLFIISNANTPGIDVADAVICTPRKLFDPSPETKKALTRVMPNYGKIANPLIIFEAITPEKFRRVIEICLDDPKSNGALLVLDDQNVPEFLALVKEIVVASKQTRKSLLVVILGENKDCEEARRILHCSSIPAFRTLEEAVSTFAYMCAYTESLELLYQTPKEISIKLTGSTFLKSLLRRVFCEGRHILNVTESMQFLQAYKIPTLNTYAAETSEEAILISSKIGYPVVIKSLHQQLTPRNGVEKVVFAADSSSEVQSCFSQIEQTVKRSASFAAFQGVAIQSKITQRGHEVFIASKNDTQFGPIILFGTRENASQTSKDLSVEFPPINQAIAKRLIEHSSICKQPSANKAPINISLLEEILVDFSQIVTDFPEIKEIDIDPLMVNESGIFAVNSQIVIDADRMIREVADHQEHLAIPSYPRKYVTIRKLKNEIEVLLRPIKPEDEFRFHEFLQSLTEESMRFRFFEIMKEMSHLALTKYCNLDYDREIAVVAELQDTSRKIVGAVGIICDQDKKCGEFAVLVTDEWHRLGLGLKLMNHIIEIAKDMNLNRIYGHVIRDNYKMVNLCNKIGFQIETLDENTLKMSLTIAQ